MSERRKEIEQLTNWINEMSEDERKELLTKVNIKHVNGEDIKYSERNLCLIACQCPNATMVGGFMAWKEKGFDINPGCPGISIWAMQKNKPKLVTIYDIGHTQRGYFDIAQAWTMKGNKKYVESETVQTK